MTGSIDINQKVLKIGPYVFGGSMSYPRKKYGFPFFSHKRLPGGRYVTIGPVMLTALKLTPKQRREGQATIKPRDHQ